MADKNEVVGLEFAVRAERLAEMFSDRAGEECVRHRKALQEGDVARADVHRRNQKRLNFMAEHVVPGVTYRLRLADLFPTELPVYIGVDGC